MRCKEVKRWIDQGLSNPDQTTREHIQSCPACARAAEAARILDRGFKAAKMDETVEHFAAARARVETAAAEKMIKERIMDQIKEQIHTRPKLFAGLGLAAAAILIFTLVPVSYTHTAGYKVSIPGIDPDAALSPGLVSAAMSTIGYRGVDVSVTPRGASADYTFSNLPSEREARDLGTAFALLTGSERKPRVDPVRVAVSLPLYAWAAEKVKPAKEEPAKKKPVKLTFCEGKIIINSRDILEVLTSLELSDKEVKKELEQVLTDDGGEDLDVHISVETDADTEDRVVNIEIFSGKLRTSDDKPIVLTLSEDDTHLAYDGKVLMLDGSDPENMKLYEEKASLSGGIENRMVPFCRVS